MSDSESRAAARLIFEFGVLKRTPRAGWAHAQVANSESVAEHSHRTALIAAILAAMEGADPNRAALLGTVHDTGETRTGDVTKVGRRYVETAANERIAIDQAAGAPQWVSVFLADAISEFEADQTIEAQVARDADALECLMQAVEYHRAGNQSVQGWIDSSRGALKTGSAKRIADAAVGMTTLEWRDF
ncbi:HD family hydrolase [Cryptosporangium sp. NPDC048952]|uniref:HD domain-containing protein n=1 Tax=Cryptosporangium sp. NPDC048952 TaxID=3363961 RepID=UPI003723A118